jgi:O-acetylserine/cysteine efflux transporter
MASAAFFLGEAITWWKIAAGALVLGGLALNQFGARAWESLRWNPTTTTKEPLP